MGTQHIERRDLPGYRTAVVRGRLPVAELGAFVGRAIAAVADALNSQGISPAGPPFARFHRHSPGDFDVEVGFPTPRDFSPAGDVQPSALPGGPAAVMVYVGPYDEMEPAYGALAGWIAQHGEQPVGDPWEIYFSDPTQEPEPQKWRTEIVMPLRTSLPTNT